MIYWIFLFVAIFLEVTAQSFLKASNGSSRLLPTVIAFSLFPLCTFVHSFALKEIEVSTAYAVWSGVGTVAMGVIGYIVFKEQISLMKAVFMLVIICGVLGLLFSK